MGWKVKSDMESKEPKNKSNGIVEAFATGSTCEQILAADRTLTYSDIFHAISETPTRYWRKFSGRNWFKNRVRLERPFRKALQHRAD